MVKRQVLTRNTQELVSEALVQLSYKLTEQQKQVLYIVSSERENYITASIIQKFLLVKAQYQVALHQILDYIESDGELVNAHHNFLIESAIERLEKATIRTRVIDADIQEVIAEFDYFKFDTVIIDCIADSTIFEYVKSFKGVNTVKGRVV